MKNIFKHIFALSLTAALLAGVSCTRTQELVFDQTSTQRVKQLVDNTWKVLTSEENGWIMYYYPHPDRIYGGYLYTMSFTSSGEVTVWSDLYAESYTSLFSIHMNDGPIFTVDTGNKAFHHFSTPTSKLYQAYKGDFEFIIESAAKNEVILRGRRSNNIIRMVPLPSGETPASYMEKVKTVKDALSGQFAGTLAGEKTSVILDGENRQASVVRGDDTIASAPFCFTADGILFYDAVDVAGTPVTGFGYDIANSALLARADDKVEASMTLVGWHSYEEYLGEWDLVFNNDGGVWDYTTHADIKLVENVNGESYYMEGMNSLYKFRVDYHAPSGSLRFISQIVGDWGSNKLAVTSFTLNSVSATSINVSGWNLLDYPNCGFQTNENVVRTEEEGKLALSFSAYNTAVVGGRAIVALGLAVVKADGSWVAYGNTDDLIPYHLFNNDRYIAPFWVSMTKK